MGDQDLFLLVLSVVRELVLAAALGGSDSSGKDLSNARIELQHAVELLGRFDDITRSTGNARRHLDDIGKCAEGLRTELQTHLTGAAQMLRG